MKVLLVIIIVGGSTIVTGGGADDKTDVDVKVQIKVMEKWKSRQMRWF